MQYWHDYIFLVNASFAGGHDKRQVRTVCIGKTMDCLSRIPLILALRRRRRVNADEMCRPVTSKTELSHPGSLSLAPPHRDLRQLASGDHWRPKNKHYLAAVFVVLYASTQQASQSRVAVTHRARHLYRLRHGHHQHRSTYAAAGLYTAVPNYSSNYH